MPKQDTVHINARLPRQLVLYIDRLRAEMQAQKPERVITRTDVLVRCIEASAMVGEAKEQGAPPSTGGAP